jgi:hypothetical protein
VTVSGHGPGVVCQQTVHLLSSGSSADRDLKLTPSVPLLGNSVSSLQHASLGVSASCADQQTLDHKQAGGRTLAPSLRLFVAEGGVC